MELSSGMLVDLVINIANILILFLVVRTLLYKPVKKFMTARTERVEAQKLNAEKLAEESKAKAAEYDNLLRECEKIKEEARKAGELSGREEAHKLVEEASLRAEKIIEKAEKKTDEEYKAMLEDAQDEILSLAVDASSKILEREINADDNRKTVEAFLSSVRKQGAENA